VWSTNRSLPAPPGHPSADARPASSAGWRCSWQVCRDSSGPEARSRAGGDDTHTVKDDARRGRKFSRRTPTQGQHYETDGCLQARPHDQPPGIRLPALVLTRGRRMAGRAPCVSARHPWISRDSHPLDGVQRGRTGRALHPSTTPLKRPPEGGFVA
jgi:hypothetical protein